METAIQPIAETELTGIALSGIIAEAVSAAREYGMDKWTMYEYAKADIRELNLTPDEYERAIALLTEALGV